MWVFQMIKPTDHKLHVRVDKLLNLFVDRFAHKTLELGHTEVTHTENYTNFYVYVPKERDRNQAQEQLNRIFTEAGYSIK